MVFAGFYMYIRASDRSKNSTAQLISKTIVRKSEQCLTFWYHMRGADIGSLKVYQKQNISIQRIWTKDGPQGSQWIKADVDLFKYDHYQIVFEGVIKDSNARSRGDIAIDDVYVSDGKCNGKCICIYVCFKFFMISFEFKWTQLYMLLQNQNCVEQEYEINTYKLYAPSALFWIYLYQLHSNLNICKPYE